MLNPQNASIELPALNIGLSDDAGLKKEDFELPAEVKYQRSLKILQRFSNIAIGLSAYELIYAAISLASFQSSFNIISTSIGFVSLLLSITLSYWTSNMLKSSQEGVLDPSFMYGGRWETFYQGLYTVLMLRVAASIPMIANMLFQRDYTAQQLRAYGLTYDESRYVTISNLLSNLAIPLPLFELFLSITFIQGARKFFGYIQEPSNTTTRMVHIGNVVLMASSLGLVYYTLNAKEYVDYYHLAQQFPIWGLNDLIIIGAEFAVLSVAVWFVNHFKWKAPHVGITVLLLALTAVTVFFAGNAFAHSRQIFNHYQNTSNLNSWQNHVQAIHPSFIENYGCPSKYLPTEKCDNPFSSECLNTNCAGLIGGLQANPALQAGNCGLIAISSSLMILVGFLFSWHIGWRDVRTRSKRDYKWLGLLALTVIAFTALMITHRSPFESFKTAETTTAPVVEKTESEYVASSTTTTGTEPRIVKPNQGLISTIGDTIINKVQDLTSGQSENNLGDKIKDFMTGTSSPLLTDEFKQQISGGQPDQTISPKTGISTIFEQLNADGTTLGPVSSESTTETTNPSLVLNVQPVSPYKDALRGLAYKKYRFLTLKHDKKNSDQIRILAGPWDMSFENFANTFDKKHEQIGFAYLGEPNKENLYMIVSGPSNTDSAQIIQGFQLPADLRELGQINSISINDASELISENIIANSKIFGEKTTMLADIDALTDETLFLAADGSDHAKLWDRIRNKDFKYEILKKDWINPNNTITTTGDWTATFSDFVSAFEPQHDQVGFVYVGSKGNEQLYMVIYHPLSSASKVLEYYQLPSDTGLLKKWNVPKVYPFATTDRKTITLKNIITKSTTNGQVAL